MKIKSLQIKNFKSIEDLVLIEPNPFSVFVGPNGAGKSNIFEALVLTRLLTFLAPESAIKLLGRPNDILKQQGFSFNVEFDSFKSFITLAHHNREKDIVSKSLTSDNFLMINGIESKVGKYQYLKTTDYNQFFRNFFKIFLGDERLKPISSFFSNVLLADGSNVERILRTLFQNLNKRKEIVECLKVLIPEFRDIEITTSELSGEVNFYIYEKHTSKPFPKYLISDGTKNILALLTAVYQSDEPQFLCIEEPENGLHPQVIKELVNLFRTACEEKGHYIWLNTHSETLVRQLRPEELILVDKKNGATQVKQLKGIDTFGLEMDEAWLTNSLNGGVI